MSKVELNEYEVILVKWNILSKIHETVVDFIKASSREAARGATFWKYGDVIDIQSVELVVE